LAAVLFVGSAAGLLVTGSARAGVVGPNSPPRDGLTRPELKRFYDGQHVFKRDFTPEEGLGPRYNAKSCLGCHQSPLVGAVGPYYNNNLHYGVDLRWPIGLTRQQVWLLFGLSEGKEFVGLAPGGGSLFHERARDDVPHEFVPRFANAMSSRRIADARGTGALAQIPGRLILRNQRLQERDHPVMAGRAVHDEDGNVAVFGSQLHFPTNLRKMVATAFEAEIGLDRDELALLVSARGTPVVDAVADFLDFAEPPPSEPTGWRRESRPTNPQVIRGRQVFEEALCSVCHHPTYELPDGRVIRPYSDFLLHDLGMPMDDGVALGEAKASEYRTTPLWGYFDRARHMHDERAGNIFLAMQWHGGQAAPSREAWSKLSDPDQHALKKFLQSIKTIEP
jgi:CxxC motif-containing protein (DUF1111 family)